MTRIDANVILRYLLGDHPEHAVRAAEVIDRSPVFVAVEVLCEVVYVLGGVYSVERKMIAEKLAEFIRLDNISVDDARVLMVAFDLFAQTKIDFVDSLLCAYNKVCGDTVVTFDQKLLKLMDVS